jgi:hypothetical protein
MIKEIVHPYTLINTHTLVRRKNARTPYPYKHIRKTVFKTGMVGLKINEVNIDASLPLKK